MTFNQDVKAESLVFIGSQRLLDNFVLPNIGLDLPIYAFNSDTETLEEIAKKQITKTLM